MSKPNIDLNKCKNSRCKCSNNLLWRKMYVMKEIPAHMVGNIGGEPSYTSIEVLCCAKCGKPHPSMMKFLIEPVPTPEVNLKISKPEEKN